MVPLVNLKALLVIYSLWTLTHLPSIPTPLNSNDGIHNLYILTVLTFSIPTLGVILTCLLSRWLLVIASALSSLVILFDRLIPNSPNIIDYSVVNTGLFNPLGQYHPPMLFFFAISGLYITAIDKMPIRLYSTAAQILICSLFFSGWWANQELFWGNYWNWDPVELSSCLVATTFIIILHSRYGAGISRKTSPGILTPLIIYLAYITNRGPTANSVHRFSDTFFLKIDTIWFWLLWYVVIFIIIYRVIRLFGTRQPRWVLNLRILNPVLLGLLILLTFLLFLILSIDFFNQPKYIAKYFFIGVCVGLVISGVRGSVMVPKTPIHLTATLLFLILCFYTEPPTNSLFLGDTINTFPYVIDFNNYLSINKFGIQYGRVSTGVYKTGLKHQTNIVRYWSTNITPQYFIKYNTNSKFIVLDTVNSIKLLFLLIVRRSVYKIWYHKKYKNILHISDA